MSTFHNTVANAMLSQAFSNLNCSKVMWGGAQGAQHYHMSDNISVSQLKDLASWSDDDSELLQLAIGWWRAQSPEIKDDPKDPLIIVIYKLVPKLLANIISLQAQGVKAVIILLDETGCFISQGKSSLCSGSYAESFQLPCFGPIDYRSMSYLCASLIEAFQAPGVKLVHIVDSSYQSSPPLTYTPFNWCSFPLRTRDHKTLEDVLLEKLVEDLRGMPDILAMWMRSINPGPLSSLGERLYPCSIEGLIWQIAGSVYNNKHLLVFLSTTTLPKILSDLMNLGNCPVTLVLMDGGTSFYDEQGYPQHPAKLHDFSLLGTVPDIVLGIPSNEHEAHSMVLGLLKYPGLSAIRLTSVLSMGTTTSDNCDNSLTPGRGRCLCEGDDISLICLGTPTQIALLSLETLRSWGLSVGVYDMRYLYPLDKKLLDKALKAKYALTLEEHSIDGGLGTAVAERIAELAFANETIPKLLKIGLDRDFMDCAPEDHGISLTSVLQAVREALQLS